MVDSSHRHRLAACALLLLFLTLALAGCAKSNFDSEVTGTVTLDGTPIGPGSIVFISQEPVPPGGQPRNPATGAIQPDGSYELKTANEFGLRSGKYKVTVIIVDQPIPAPGERSMAVPKSRIPEKYNTVETTDLEYEVTAGRNSINVALASQ